MPRPRYVPCAQPQRPKRRRREPSPEIEAEVSQSSPVPSSEPESPSVAALTEDQLLKFMLDWPTIDPEQHDSILLGVFESAVEKVGFGDENLEEIYSFFINTIPIRGQKNQASAYVAFCSCQKAKCYDIGELILKSLIRSMRLALTSPLDSEDFLFLVNKLPEFPAKFASLFEELALENHSVRIDHLRVLDDAKILETATDIVPVGFKNAQDLLENPDRVDVDRRDCVRQVKMILDQVFISRRDLVRSHSRALAKVVKKLQYCPESAIPTIKLLATTSLSELESNRKTFLTSYALSLIFVTYLDIISPRAVAALPEILSLITRTYIAGTRMLRDVLGALGELYRSSVCSSDQEFIQTMIMDKVVEIIRKTETYEDQLDIVGFIEDLRVSEVPIIVYSTLCEKAEGLGVINRVCALLLSAEHACNNNSIQKAIKRQVKQRNRKLNEVKIENPQLYEYMRRFMV